MTRKYWIVTAKTQENKNQVKRFLNTFDGYYRAITNEERLKIDRLKGGE
jgi:hypothetical protein